MIDFRYHMVSLMAVLIALTIGVILGAGPLQGPLSETLTGQVDRITQQQRQLNKDNESLRAQNEADTNYIEAVGDKAVAQSLTGVPVCMIRTVGAAAKDADRVSKYLHKAGATLTLQVQLNEAWLSDKDTKTRSALANRAAGYLSAEQKGQGSEDILAHTLLAAMTTATPNTQVMRNLLAAGDRPLASFSTAATPCQGVVLVTGAHSPKDPFSTDAVTALGKALGSLAGGGVVVGDGSSEGQVVTMLRQATVSVATVDSVSTPKAAISAPLALAQARAGKKEAYGVQSGASLVAPGANS